MAKRMSKAEKALENAYHDSMKRQMNNIQFNVMDFSNMRNEALAAVQNGKSMDDAVAAVITKYRQN